MILVGLGGNLPHPTLGAPSNTLARALGLLEAHGVRLARRSRWYTSAPEPAGDLPWYTNGVAVVETTASPAELLRALLEIERSLGRRRRAGERNASRTVDLDLLAYHDVVQAPKDGGPTLPHPRMHARAFVLKPLAEIAPGWVHPTLNRTVEELIAALPPGADALPMSA